MQVAADHAALNAAFRARDPRGDRLRVPAARDPGPRHRRRLLALAPGPERRHDRVPGREPPEVPGGRAQAAGARQRQQRLAAVRAADLRRRRPRQGPQAGRRDQRRLPDAAGVPRRHLRQPVQPLRPPVAGLPAGRGRGPRPRRGHRPVLRPQQRREDGAALGARDHGQHPGARVHQSLQPLPGRAGHGHPGARLQLGPGDGGARGGRAARSLPREMGYDWADLSYQEARPPARRARSSPSRSSSSS